MPAVALPIAKTLHKNINAELKILLSTLVTWIYVLSVFTASQSVHFSTPSRKFYIDFKWIDLNCTFRKSVVIIIIIIIII
jgi:hypothetical protein